MIPKKEDVVKARKSAGLSQSKAASLVYRSLRNWQQMESGERPIDPAIFELFILKTSK